MTMVYYHNPRCSKSREGLKILKEKKVGFAIKEYLKEPLTASEIKELCNALKMSPSEIVRSKEEVFKDLGLHERKMNDQSWYQIIVKNPVLLERPILLKGKKAVIGRPTERLLELLKK